MFSSPAQSKKKGMSLEDKRTAILEVFHETSDVFTLKDIEKLGTKKGVVTQTIKDVLQSLVDDDLVRQDKIGISNFFWSFPGEAGAKLTRDKQNLERQLESLQALKRTLETELAGQMANKVREIIETRVKSRWDSSCSLKICSSFADFIFVTS